YYEIMNFGSNIKNILIYITFLIILSFGLLFNRLNFAPLNIDDCCFIQIAKEMVLTKEYMTYKLGGKIFFDNKPPMFLWILAISGKIFGFNNFSMRLPSAIFGLISVLCLFIFISKFFNNYTLGFLTSFIFLFTQQVLYYSRSATMEILYSLFIFLSLVSFWHGYYYNKKFGFYLTGIFVGFAVMTRNIVGFLVYGVIFVYLLIVRENRVLKNLHFWLGIFLSILISLPWHLYMLVNFGKEFSNAYFNVIIRYFFKEKKLWYEYIRKILENYWPWLPFLIMGIYNEIKNVFFNKQRSELKQFSTLMLIFTIILFLLLNISKYKFPQHLMPLYFPFAIFSAKYLLKLDIVRNYIFTKIFIFMGVLYVVISIFYPILPLTLDSQEYKNTIKMFEYIKSIKDDIYVLEDEYYWHYHNGALVYADKKVIAVPKNISKFEKGYLLLKKKVAGRYENFKEYYKVYETLDDLLLYNNNKNLAYTQQQLSLR
ncbi:MAG: glycosyltransferase family 39 protein, partial [Candidatus Aenigmarchaeota archaeon]|nr:glycosyltransferase family 39 protein [Candidatus Aenigmarchaeota archaeon]MDW8149350.1 glycosyltransferase family 39 protein [Candidatus Aenigmarchaeota archaeon]